MSAVMAESDARSHQIAKGVHVRTIEIRVPEKSLAGILNSMREWLDREKCDLSHFRYTSGEDGVIVISAGFPNPDDPRVDAFHRRFANARTVGSS